MVAIRVRGVLERFAEVVFSLDSQGVGRYSGNDRFIRVFAFKFGNLIFARPVTARWMVLEGRSWF